MRFVVVSPHRDDAAFSLGLSVAAWTLEKHRVEVLNCFTQSTYAPFSDAESLHPNDRLSFVSATRKREDIAWGKLLRPSPHFTDLDLLDAPLRLGCAVDEVLTQEIRPGDRALARVAGALRKLLTRSQAGEIAFVLPLSVGSHIDHRITHAAALEVFAAQPAVPLAFYEDLPYTARAETAAEVEQLVKATGMSLQPWFADTPIAEPATAAAHKLRAAQQYDSQIENDTARQIADFCLHYGGREQLWANPAWIASVPSVPLGHSDDATGAEEASAPAEGSLPA